MALLARASFKNYLETRRPHSDSRSIVSQNLAKNSSRNPLIVRCFFNFACIRGSVLIEIELLWNYFGIFASKFIDIDDRVKKLDAFKKLDSTHENSI